MSRHRRTEALKRAYEHERQTREAVRDALAALDRAIGMNARAADDLRMAEVAWAIWSERVIGARQQERQQERVSKSDSRRRAKR